MQVVHEIVRKHGGQVSVAVTPGRGTQICIHLPLARRPAQPEQKTVRVSANAGARAHVLLIGFAEPVRSLVADALRSAGHEVLPGEELPREGCDAARGSGMRVAIIDVDGVDADLVERPGDIREGLGFNRVVLVGERAEVRPCGSASVDGVLRKPYTLAALVDCIARMLTVGASEAA